MVSLVSTDQKGCIQGVCKDLNQMEMFNVVMLDLHLTSPCWAPPLIKLVFPEQTLNRITVEICNTGYNILMIF